MASLLTANALLHGKPVRAVSATRYLFRVGSSLIVRPLALIPARQRERRAAGEEKCIAVGGVGAFVGSRNGSVTSTDALRHPIPSTVDSMQTPHSHSITDCKCSRRESQKLISLEHNKRFRFSLRISLRLGFALDNLHVDNKALRSAFFVALI